MHLGFKQVTIEKTRKRITLTSSLFSLSHRSIPVGEWLCVRGPLGAESLAVGGWPGPLWPGHGCVPPPSSEWPLYCVAHWEGQTPTGPPLHWYPSTYHRVSNLPVLNCYWAFKWCCIGCVWQWCDYLLTKSCQVECVLQQLPRWPHAIQDVPKGGINMGKHSETNNKVNRDSHMLHSATQTFLECYISDFFTSLCITTDCWGEAVCVCVCVCVQPCMLAGQEGTS